MKYDNRLILDEDQDVRIHLAGAKITTAHGAGNFGFSKAAAETDVIELQHVLDSSSEPVFITRALFTKMQAAFRRLGGHVARAVKAKAQAVEGTAEITDR